ncbi:MAG: response regulator [Acidobacteriota bacterium]
MPITTYTAPFEIIMAEDNPVDVALVRQAIHEHQLNCRLRVIRDGAEALTLISNLDADPTAPALDLLLIDMHQPKRDGAAILDCLRSTERYAQTPVIIMTSSPSRIIEEMDDGHAALVYFQKPSTLAEFMELGAIMRRVLGVGKARDETAHLADGKLAGGVA